MEIQNKEGKPIKVIITDFSENIVTLDANHPLVDKDLTFEITLHEVINN